jgi:hypothetical protein
MPNNKPHEYDEYVIEEINNAVDAWIEGGGHEGNFITMIYEGAKRFYAMKHSEWRGAILIYILIGSGIRVTKDATISFKLLALDCLAAWQKNTDDNKEGWDKTKVLVEIERVRNYFLKDFGLYNSWCREVLDKIVAVRLKERIWSSLVG